MSRAVFLLVSGLLGACKGGAIAIKDGADTAGVDTGLDTALDTVSETALDSDTGADSAADTGSETGLDTDTGGETDTDTDTDTDVEVVPDIVVDCNGSADFTTIQDAIDASVSGDVIGVMACAYHERISYLGKSIVVYGIDGSGSTILNGDEGGTVLSVVTGEGADTRFAGFTITGGYNPAAGSAVELNTSNLELEDVQIRGNSDGASVVENLGGWLDMADVTVSGNVVNSDGQAILADGGSLTAEGLDVNCDGGTSALKDHVSINIDRSSFVCDTGYGIENYHGEIWLQRSTATGGLAGIYTFDEAGTPEEPDSPNEHMYIVNSAVGGGSIGVDVLYEDVRIVNSVLWGTDAALSMTLCNTESYARNSVFMNAACGILGDQDFPSRYSAFWNNTADGCGVTVTPSVSDDPMFTSFPDDLSLLPDSPLIDAGDPAASYDDEDGSRDDIGRYGGPWGDE